MFDSVTMKALNVALDGLAERQRVTAQNVANVNTPHYLAKKVSFESALAKSVAAGDGTAKLTNSYSLDETKLNGNNVNLDTETLTNVETVLRYQFASRAVDHEFSMVRTALRTS
ncbi:flagellar basal body rod protein FlgB [Naasia lichenicola]|uniref:Flagellar basal body rod protein FlgB n=1 Tax=Naasia lichenicola TaxID=2565933 RepID=A0A4S4FHZ8_9MICO|nr:flagellar biosynthesis protein FlgB [Naasia lichenicola]THG29668.1 flagellar biosynthesis protein FlgB [Naasia lichenicola]